MFHRSNPRSRFFATSVLVVALSMAAGCAPRSRNLEPGLYRAVVELPGGDVPFGLDVVRGQAGIELYLVNGKERLRVPEAKAVTGRLTAQLPGTGNRLRARIRGDELEGEVTLTGTAGRRTELEFSATRGQDWRFVEEPRTDNADFSGRWAFTFTDDTGAKMQGVADFTQSFHAIAGTVRTAGWQQPPLAGDANDEELSLSLFDGRQAVLYKGKLDERGELVGECWSTAIGHLRYTATRNPDATL
jgi:hypothetical protein